MLDHLPNIIEMHPTCLYKILFNNNFLLCRMYPVVIGNGRCLTKEMDICGFTVPKGVSSHKYLLF